MLGDHAVERVGESILFVGVLLGVNDRDRFSCWKSSFRWPSILGDHAADRFGEVVVAVGLALGGVAGSR